MHNFCVFGSSWMFTKTAAAWPRSEWMPHSNGRCDRLILRSSPVCEWCTAHMSARVSALIILVEPRHFLETKKYIFCFVVYFAETPKSTIYTCGFVLMTWRLGTQKYGNNTSDGTHPWLWARMHTSYVHPWLYTPMIPKVLYGEAR